MTTGLFQGRRLTPEVGASALVIIVLGAYLAWRAAIVGAGWSTFVVCGTDGCDASAVPPELVIAQPGVGYDGRFFYRLSLDPLTSERVAFGIPLDESAYRQQRIFFPLLAYLLNAATGISTLIWLPLLAIAGCVLATIAAASLLREAGVNPWWSLAIGLAPGLAVGARLDTAEPLAIGLALSGLAVVRNQPWLATVLLTCAVLTRETTLAIAAGVGIIALLDVVRYRLPPGSWTRLTASLVPLLAFLGWQAWLARNWDAGSVDSTTSRIGTPLVDVARSLIDFDVDYADVPMSQELLWWLLRVIIIVVILAGVAGLRSSTISPHAKAGFIVALGITLILEGLLTPWQAARATVEGYVLGMLIVTSHPRLRPFAAIAAPALVIILVSA